MKKYISALILVIAGAALGGCTISINVGNNPPSSPTPAIEPTAVISKEPIVGGDKDEHGCIGSAGYSWCEVKQKCLRIWEESCEDEEKAIKEAVAASEGIPVDDIKVSQKTATHAKGGMTGAMFLVVKKNGKWVVDYAGNGVADCKKLKADNFPSAMLKGVCE